MQVFPFGQNSVKNVGIGTTSPSSTLTVNGNIESKSGGFKFPDGSMQITSSAQNFLIDSWSTRTGNICYSSSGRYILRSTSYTKQSSATKLVVEARLSARQTSSASISYAGINVGSSYSDQMAYTVTAYEPLRIYTVMSGITAGAISVNTYIGRNDTNSVCYVLNPTSSDDAILPSATTSIITIYEIP